MDILFLFWTIWLHCVISYQRQKTIYGNSSWKTGEIDAWPARMSFLLFAGCALGDKKFIKLWEDLEPESIDNESAGILLSDNQSCGCKGEF